MAESDTKQQIETVQADKQQLKYLDFLQTAAIYVVVCFSTIYDYAKENSGPLKPGVQTVEGTVKTVIGPVYEKFEDVPFELLKFVDRKVDEAMSRHVPSFIKQASTKALLAAQKAPEVARSVASDLQQNGVVDTVSNIVKTSYAKYEPVAEQYAVSAWRALNRLPLFPQVAHIVVPTAAYWTEKYNQSVTYAAENDYAASYYLPLVPVERIAKVFEGSEGGPTVSPNGEVDVTAQ